VIPVRDLDEAGRSVSFPVPAAWLRAALAGCEMQPAGSDGEAGVRVSKTGQSIVVRGQIAVDFVVGCARCLAPVALRPSIELSLVLTPVSAPPRKPPKRDGDDEHEFGSDDTDHDTYEGDEVVLDRFIREAVLLEAPSFPLCSESCEGIRPHVAASASESREPRLAKLIELAQKRTTKE
jgi:uncharacterized protein